VAKYRATGKVYQEMELVEEGCGCFLWSTAIVIGLIILVLVGIFMKNHLIPIILFAGLLVTVIIARKTNRGND